MFGLFLAFASPKPLELPTNREFDLEHFCMVRTALTDDEVCRNTAKFFLGVLLKLTFVVSIPLMQDGIQVLLKALQDYLIHISQRAIKINGRQHCFKGISQERCLITPAGQLLPRPTRR